MAFYELPRPLDDVHISATGNPHLRRHVSAHLAALGARVDARHGDHHPTPSASFTIQDGSQTRLGWSSGAGRPTGIADEATAQAACGLMHVHGRRSGRPVALAMDYVTACAASATAMGVLAAEIARSRGMPPTLVDVAADACALLSVSQYLAATCAPDAEAVAIAPGGATFTTADGVAFEIEALTTEPWAAFWRELGAPREAISAGWAPFQFRYATACAPLPEELRTVAAASTWERVRTAARMSGTSLARVRTPQEHPLRKSAADEEPVWWTLGALTPAPPSPRLRQPMEAGLPLAGVTVLEAGRRVQAPMAAHLLWLLGATVIRIEPPGGDPLRGMPPTCGKLSARWLALNRGKDAVEIDIKDPAGRSQLLDLAAGADVFLHNWAPGKAEELGLDAEAFARANPGIVHAHTSGWGGGIADAPMGTDFMVQAHTATSTIEPSTGTRSIASLMTILDVLGGFLGAQTVLAALLARLRSGRGVRAESSLLGAAHTLAARPQPRPARLVATRDGWVATRGDAPVPLTLAPGATNADVVRRLRSEGVAATPVTTDLTTLPDDPRIAGLLSRDSHGAVAVATPWRLR
ncbi:CoA transferase [Salinactinospora qingdaonensis]|uniref:Crotonobetainyl-CoA:carnitine CoA-transferase CaiB n=1 Tax=Salinactinospora qingdaonensis TaxID=702744 RepID=A0ABP7FU42_9ACTN